MESSSQFPRIEEFRILWTPDRSVTARMANGLRSPAVLLAHGAGAGQDHPGIVTLQDGLARAGFPVLTFNYPYIEEGRGRPDPTETLLACHRAAADWLHEKGDGPLVLAGRSMGGRMGTLLAAAGEPCAGLILYAYPLHPIGKPDRLRVDHLTAIRQPMLFLTGTRDAMARLDLAERWIGSLPNATLHLVPDGDHSFRVRRTSGLSNEQVLSEVISSSVGWLEAL